MRLLTIVRVVAVVCAGLTAGIFLGYLVSAPARGALSASSFVQHQQVVHMYYVRMMPPLILAAVLAGLTWLSLLRSQWRGAEFRLIAAFIGLSAELVFYPGSFTGWATSLIENFGEGRYLGVPLLQRYGMAFEPRRAAELGVEPYPHMIRWLR